MTDWRVVLFDTSLDSAEIEAVGQVLSSGWLSLGAVTRAFEQEFAAALGLEEAGAVSSGTAALHLAVLSLGLEPGDEVIMPALTFVATAAVVALTGARPIFAEIESLDTLMLSAEDVQRRITARTRAIIVTHYAGYAANMPALIDIARRHNLVLIEDAAHAPLVRTDAGMLGTLGDIGCFSFFATKNLTTGEGGMVVARSPERLDRIRLLRSHCMTTSSWDRHQGRAATYDVTGLGLNYRPTDISSALGRVQLNKLPADRAARRAMVRDYHAQLADLPGIILPFAARCAEDSAHHLLPILLPPWLSRDRLQHRLRTAGIQSSVHYPPIHLFSYYRDRYGYCPGSLPLTEAASTRELTLPLHVRLNDEQVRLVAETVRAAWSDAP